MGRYGVSTLMLTALSIGLLAVAQAPTTVSYGSHERQRVDLYSVEGQAPAMVYVHGGGWRGGNPANVGQKAEMFNAMGWHFASVGYRLVPEAMHPEQPQDVATAIAAVDLELEPSEIFVMGHSAGAQLAALVACEPRWLQQAGVEWSRIAGAVINDTVAYDIPALMATAPNPIYEGAFGADPSRWEDASALLRAAPGAPPFLVLVAGPSRNRLLESERFAQTLRDNGGFARVIDAQTIHDHASINRTMGTNGEPVSAEVVRFVREIVGEGLDGQGSTVRVEGQRYGEPVQSPFERFDANGDGVLTRDEVPRQYHDQFDALDRNDDARVTLDEWRRR